MHTLRHTASGPIRWYWANAISTSFADNLISFALILLILRITGSVSLMAMMSIVIALPNILVAIHVAVWVDRWNPRNVVLISQLARGVIICGFLLVDRLDALWLAFVIALLQSVVGTFDDPARLKLVREMTTDETRLSVNSFTQTGRTIAGVLGTAVGGLLVGTGDETFGDVFLLASASYLVAALCVSMIRIVFETFSASELQNSSTGYASELRKGFAVINQSRTVQAVLIAAAASTIGASAATVLLTPLIVNELEIAPAWFGAIQASQAASAILISSLIGLFGSSINPRRLVILGLMITGVLIAVIGSATNLVFLLVGMFVVGLSITPISTGFSTLVQSAVQRELLGRVGSVLNMTIETFSIASIATAGLLADQIGVRPVFWIAGIICSMAGIIAATLFARDRESISAQES